MIGDIVLDLLNKEVNCNFSSLWVSICALSRTIKQLLSALEDNLEKTKHGAMEIISARANHLIDCLPCGISLATKNGTDVGNSRKIDINLYQNLINSLVDLTLVTKYNLASNEIGLLNECANLLNTVEKEIRRIL